MKIIIQLTQIAKHRYLKGKMAFQDKKWTKENPMQVGNGCGLVAQTQKKEKNDFGRTKCAP